MSAWKENEFTLVSLCYYIVLLLLALLVVVTLLVVTLQVVTLIVLLQVLLLYQLHLLYYSSTRTRSTAYYWTGASILRFLLIIHEIFCHPSPNNRPYAWRSPMLRWSSLNLPLRNCSCCNTQTSEFTGVLDRSGKQSNRECLMEPNRTSSFCQRTRIEVDPSIGIQVEYFGRSQLVFKSLV